LPTARRGFRRAAARHVRESVWGYAASSTSPTSELIREAYAGIRPAPGYPACPDHSLKPVLFKMLGGEPAGVT
jgi:5-methyltetrahydrofolate--homocysteine methyltransferase